MSLFIHLLNSYHLFLITMSCSTALASHYLEKYPDFFFFFLFWTKILQFSFKTLYWSCCMRSFHTVILHVSWFYRLCWGVSRLMNVNLFVPSRAEYPYLWSFLMPFLYFFYSSVTIFLYSKTTEGEGMRNYSVSKMRAHNGFLQRHNYVWFVP